MSSNTEGFVDVEGTGSSHPCHDACAPSQNAGKEELAIFLRAVGVVDAATVAAVMAQEQLHDEDSFLSLDGDDIAELLTMCQKAGVSVGDRSKLKNAIRRSGNTHVPETTPRRPMVASRAVPSPAPEPEFVGETKTAPSQTNQPPLNFVSAWQSQPPPPQSPPQPQPPPQPQHRPGPLPTAQAQPQPPRPASPNPFIHLNNPHMNELVIHLLSLLNPIRTGVADFIDSMAEKYVRPHIQQQMAPQSLDGQRRSWMHSTLPRLLVIYAFVRGVSSIFTRVDSMMAFLLGFFLRKKQTPAVASAEATTSAT